MPANCDSPRLVAVVVRAPGPHAVNPAPIASRVATAAAAAAAAAKENTDAAAAAVAAMATVTTTAMMAAAAAMTAAAVAAASAAVTASAAMTDKLYTGLRRAFAFFVEDVERRQSDVRNLLLT